MNEAEQRQVMLDGMANVLAPEALATFERLVPRRRWRDAIPADVLMRRAVMEARDEHAVRQLHSALARAIGQEAADATMEFVPPVPWDVLAAQGVKVTDVR